MLRAPAVIFICMHEASGVVLILAWMLPRGIAA
jgi:hypothetical protein